MHNLHPVAKSILEARSIEDVEGFINLEYDKRPDPFLLTDMDVAVSRILQAIHSNEKICAWTDYDCDGIPAGALLSDFFEMIHYPLRSYIPERSEGYALNEQGIQKLKDEGVSLIITADAGITSNKEVAFAQSLGIDVIVTDHHLPSETLPPAVAIINPHRADDTYPFKDLCGTGVAFKLVEALLSKGSFDVVAGNEKWLLDLVALATVADMVSLTGENRTLVSYGLLVARKGRRKGMRVLLEKMRVPYRTITEDDFAFSIAPKINASSRMESPLLGLELLTTTSTERANELAKHLVNLNNARKLEGARVSKEVKKRLDGSQLSRVIVMGRSSWNPALLGIAATGIVEMYERPVCLWGKDGSLIKGSCRSDGTVNIVSLMKEAEDLFEDFGGHELSGGFSLKEGAIHQLPEALEKAYASVTSGEKKDEPMQIDGTLTLSEVGKSLYTSLRHLAPFGVENPKPIFQFSNVRVERVLYFGKHKEHTRVTISDDTGRAIDAIVFFSDRSSFKNELALLSKGDRVSVCACVEESSFGNKTELRLRIENIEIKTTVQ
ncbi:single-stranded-DNA-specific exonuclease RecJ [Candidatus Kaiserbacteria bacterium CG10_big_fil_rev_8_21_14_0_10_45_20]|uniref:Single-stranded-DNA-specific exonuclease RecJ n=1 Tax=Candidatus Kaiserbacteria bacterium CG10_big_fil_rev_8_21_14_0_10_45_20 TaxID=1974607 RepID=A0A2H0UFJ9_9BACT|nr:MAG: single-stranded-DNA-specific exonuclease RecJ [Candidatus Kaiserbacteria bacterium CG10_big_fil_rev_8_21_14_0_10_45_20]